MIYTMYRLTTGCTTKRSRISLHTVITFLALLGLIVAFASLVFFFALWVSMVKV